MYLACIEHCKQNRAIANLGNSHYTIILGASEAIPANAYIDGSIAQDYLQSSQTLNMSDCWVLALNDLVLPVVRPRPDEYE